MVKQKNKDLIFHISKYYKFPPRNDETPIKEKFLALKDKVKDKNEEKNYYNNINPIKFKIKPTYFGYLITGARFILRNNGGDSRIFLTKINQIDAIFNVNMQNPISCSYHQEVYEEEKNEKF